MEIGYPAFNQLVAGSNPARPTKQIKRPPQWGGLFICKRFVVDSFVKAWFDKLRQEFGPSSHRPRGPYKGQNSDKLF